MAGVLEAIVNRAAELLQMVDDELEALSTNIFNNSDLASSSASSDLQAEMARLRGRARRGQRCRAAVPHGHWTTTTFTGALRLSGMTAPMVLDGPMNGDAFEAYVEQVLVPTLRPGEIVIMDNLPAHRRPTIRAAIEAAGAVLRHLPPYSPDFTRSRMLSRSSRRCCARQRLATSTISGTPSETRCLHSLPRSAQVTSKLRDMSRNDRNPL